MSVAQKQALWRLLVDIGVKEIEVGFPSASQPDHDFVRWLIEERQIPEDVTIQVLTQAREDLIQRTFAALDGVHQAIVHVYNSTSPVQREWVFGADRAGVKAIAVRGAELVQREAAKYPGTRWIFQYSPESYSQTEPDYAVEVVNAVLDVWRPTPEHPCIVNLPATVESASPNVFADQVEWFCRHLDRRESVIVSLHTHNDRGGAAAAAELGLLAGADRLEGTLLGNGERTGNMDLVTVAMNLYSQGVDPKLDLSDPDRIIAVTERCTGIACHPRHPGVGELVYTAFSGSHQDAIGKSLRHQRAAEDLPWQVAYLPIDPADIGRSYEAVIRVNSQSGKGGIAYLLESEYGLQLPRRLQIEFSQVVQREMDASGKELAAADLWALFQREYGLQSVQAPHYRLSENDGVVSLSADLSVDGGKRTVEAQGTGPIDAFVQALSEHSGRAVRVLDYNEHAIGEGANAKAIAYVELRVDELHVCYGVGVDANIVSASFRAIMSGLQRVPSAEKVTVQEAVAA
jgi:2-isopropylmalate synthase